MPQEKSPEPSPSPVVPEPAAPKAKSSVPSSDNQPPPTTTVEDAAMKEVAEQGYADRVAGARKAGKGSSSALR